MKQPAWFVAIARHACELRCVMVGGAHPDEPALYRRVARAAADVPNLRFHGQVQFVATGAPFATAGVFVNASSFGGFTNTYWQAWANGVPVIATFDPDGVIAQYGLDVILGARSAQMPWSRATWQCGRGGHSRRRQLH